VNDGSAPQITAELVIFVILAAATIGGALMTITRRNPVTAVMSLVATFFALAGIYATLNAHFVAILQILVYAGAIMVLFIFVVMILNRDEVQLFSFKGILTRAIGVLAVAYVSYLGAWVVWDQRTTSGVTGAILRGGITDPPAGYGTVAGVGNSLFREFVFPFEAISVLLLVAIVGGLIVSRSAHVTELAEERFRKLHDIQSRAQGEVRLLPDGRPAEGADDAHASAGHH
jgi:NADH-quinone oxidoreductase subunit J